MIEGKERSPKKIISSSWELLLRDDYTPRDMIHIQSPPTTQSISILRCAYSTRLSSLNRHNSSQLMFGGQQMYMCVFFFARSPNWHVYMHNCGVGLSWNGFYKINWQLFMEFHFFPWQKRLIEFGPAAWQIIHIFSTQKKVINQEFLGKNANFFVYFYWHFCKSPTDGTAVNFKNFLKWNYSPSNKSSSSNYSSFFRKFI